MVSTWASIGAEDGKNEISRVTPKKGRLVLFDGGVLHAGQPPKTSEVRCVININFKKVANF
jgi:hypothetical protein